MTNDKLTFLTADFLTKHRNMRRSRQVLLNYPFTNQKRLPKLLRRNTDDMQRLERLLLTQLPSISLTVGAEEASYNRATSNGVTITRRKSESQAAFQRRVARTFPFADATGGLLLMRTIIFGR